MISDTEQHSQFDDLDPNEMQTRAEELASIPDLKPDKNGTITCPVLPLRNVILFPNMVAPMPIGRHSTMLAIEEVLAANHIMLALPQRDPSRKKPRQQDFLPIGVTAAVSEVFSAVEGQAMVMMQGRARVEVQEYFTSGAVLYARGRLINEVSQPGPQEEALMRHLMREFERYAGLNETVPDEALDYLYSLESPGMLADMVASSFAIRLKDRHQLLTMTDTSQRLSFVTSLLSREVDVLEIEDEIDLKVADEVERGNRESYLRERMRVIQRELGEEDPWTRELKDLHARIKAAGLPDAVEEATNKELDRLYQMPPMSPEVAVVRTYIDWVLDLPWHEETEDNLDVDNAAKVLDANHYGLEKAKDRILEYIAVKSLKPESVRQPILCFVGPPGTGKTSLGRSIAKALGRKFVRLSLGGVRDEAEMRGHRRTYIGALPGRILQTMKRAGTINPLFVLDEIDKLDVGYRGDPAAALLEVLDPEQNNAFSDHYLEQPYDLSNVMFITTANNREDIPWALLDRMEEVEFPGYVEEDKIEIAKQFLIKRQIEQAGLEPEELRFTDPALQRVIREYTYEAGVRNLEREIGRTCRKVARLKAEGKKAPDVIGVTEVEKFLGPPQFTETEAEREDEVGVATAVAWTQGGGDIMPVEVVLLDGKGNLQLTGQMGDVMQESAQAAMSYMKSRAKAFKLDSERFEETDMHVHIPEGAIPKDGPSAGITIATAIISAFTGQKVRKDVGMTGEITLRGRVLPVGGVRNKVLAAHRAGLKTVILPEKNKKDMVDIPKKIRDSLEVIHVSHMDEVLKVSMVSQARRTKKPAAKPKAKASDKPAAHPGV